MMLQRAIRIAIDGWSHCDWTHEMRDDDGRIVYDDDNPRYCSGDEDGCSYCDEANNDALEAGRYGRVAIDALRRGDKSAALDAVEEAASLESKWGDDPVWNPVVRLLNEAISAEACEDSPCTRRQ